MKNIENALLAKHGLVTTKIAGEFLNLEVNDRAMTISELQDKYHYSRGTIQNALKTLKDLGAINTVSKGHQGTIIIAKDESVILSIMGISSVVGCMPLPYSKRYEGLATGLISAIEDKSNIPSTIVFSRGALNRAKMLNSDRCDYIITSKLAAKNIIEEYPNLGIIKEFGPGSYLSDHVIVFHNKNDKDIKEGMTIGIDRNSIDQCRLVNKVCENKKVKYIDVSYPNLLKKVIKGDIDATVWNKDEIFDKYLDVNYKVIEKDDSDTNAVMLVKKDRKEIIDFLKRYMENDYILRKMRLVIEGLETPRY